MRTTRIAGRLIFLVLKESPKKGNNVFRGKNKVEGGRFSLLQAYTRM